MSFCQVILLVACLAITLTSATDCEIWEKFDRATYNTTYVDVIDRRANEVRPHGFKSMRWQKATENPCIIVPLTGPGSPKLELMFRIEEGELIYATENITGDANSNLFQNTFSQCVEVPAGENAVQYTFHCDESDCDAKEVWLWYRFEEIPEGTESGCNMNFEEFPKTFGYYYEPEPEEEEDADVVDGEVGTTSQVVTISSQDGDEVLKIVPEEHSDEEDPDNGNANLKFDRTLFFVLSTSTFFYFVNSLL